jgi:predicted histidine transporter YuiF (NhaC family)
VLKIFLAILFVQIPSIPLGGAAEELQKTDVIYSVQWWIIGLLVGVIIYQERKIASKEKEIKDIRENENKELREQLKEYERKNK